MWKIQWRCCNDIFTGQNFDKTIASIFSPALLALFPNGLLGLYTPLPTPDRPWESISMDYISCLMSTKWGNYCVFVVVDHFSTMAIMDAYKKSIIA
jgi:hypothetical protein